MEKHTFLGRVVPLFLVALLVTALATAFGSLHIHVLTNPLVYGSLLVASVLVLLVLLMFPGERESFVLLLIFNSLKGFLISPLVFWVFRIDPLILTEALSVTVGLFTATFLYAWFTEKDFTSWRFFLVPLLLLALLLTVLQLFLRTTLFHLIVDAGVAILFMAFVLYDVSSILYEYPDQMYVQAATSLYIDFMAIFVRVLHLLSLVRRR
jgi:FtsH-binding integral membrane protein